VRLAGPFIRVLAYVGMVGCLLFAPARTLDWWRAWALLGVLLVVRVLGTLSVRRANPELLAERAKPLVQPGQPLADRMLLPGFMASYAGLVAFIAVDVHRLHLLASPGPLVSAVGMIFFVGGWWLVALALRTNAFAAAVVRHQVERGHAVVDAGVYGVVRHPMYAGVIAVLIGFSLWLQSYAALVLACVPGGILVIRILVEERLLRRALPGYAGYAERVRWRLMPGVW
jgi:protein-S-isoprenylcysteine O-methyltransferase Ste14